MTLKAPFPWFGGKSRVAGVVWDALGDVSHYVEPFLGSAAVLLARPSAAKLETVNDADGMVANFWRAIRADPIAVAEAADWPVNEIDLHARHAWLVGQKADLTSRLMGDPDWFCAKAAGWWVWGQSNWIGSGFCSGNGPWQVVDGQLIDTRQLPHLGNAGKGVTRQLPHLGDAGKGVNRQLPHLGNAGTGVNRQLPHLGGAGKGVTRQPCLRDWFDDLANRLAKVRVACGDWSRVTGPSVLRAAGGVCGVFLDPPYDQGMRETVYSHESDCARDVMRWALDHGNDRALRIVLAGYAGEHDALEAHGWRVRAWKANGGCASPGSGRGAANAHRERLWFSPHCLDARPDLFSEVA